MFLVRELIWVNFLTAIPDYLMYLSIFIMLVETIVFLHRIVKQLKRKSFQQRVVNKIFVGVISGVYASYWIVILSWILVRTLAYRDIASPMYLTLELYKYFIPWTFGIVINIGIIVYEIYLGNFFIIVINEDKIILMRDEIMLENALMVENKKVQFYDDQHHEEVTLRLLLPSLQEKFKSVIK